MGLTREQVEEIAGKLRAMPKIEPPPKDLTKQDAVKILAKEIKSLRTKGYSMEQIANSLKGFGLEVSTPTLRNYLQRNKLGKGKTVKQIASQEDISTAPVLVEAPELKPTESKAKFTPRKDRTGV